MKKLYNFRLDTSLIKQVDKIADNRTVFVVDALRSYLHCKDDVKQDDYNVDLVSQLRSENKHLWEIHEKLMNRVVMLPENVNEGHLQGRGEANDPQVRVDYPIHAITSTEKDSEKKKKRWWKGLFRDRSTLD